MLNIFGRFRWVGSNQMPTAMIIMAHFLTQTWLNYIWWIINCLKTSDIECEQQTINSRVGNCCCCWCLSLIWDLINILLFIYMKKGAYLPRIYFLTRKWGEEKAGFCKRKVLSQSLWHKLFFWNISCHTAFESCIISMKSLKH